MFKLCKVNFASDDPFNIAFSNEKAILSESAEKYKIHWLQEKNSSKQILANFDVRGQQRIYFFSGGSIIIDYGLILIEVTG